MLVILLSFVDVIVAGKQTKSLLKRISLNLVALKMIGDNFWLGVGAGNFINLLSSYQSNSPFYWFQPVHNIFLLWMTETGLLGTLFILKLFAVNLRYLGNKRNWLIIGIIVVTGMFDHYWLTLPQNSWLLVVVLSAL
jgi:O-antigen ligase